MHYVLALNPSFLIKRHLTFKWKFNAKSFFAFAFTLFVFSLIFYIFQVNEVTKASFFTSNYENKINILIQENKNLEIKFSQINSLANLEILLRDLNYEEVGKIHYIQILENTVVVK